MGKTQSVRNSFGNNNFSREGKMVEKHRTKIYTVFATSGYSDAGAVTKDFVTNEEIINRLKKAFGEEVDFIVRKRPKEEKRYLVLRGEVSIAPILDELSTMKEPPDGVLIFGIAFKGDSLLALTGLPTIVVYNIFEFLHTPYELYYRQGKVLTACIDRLNITKPSVSKSMFRDLVEEIKLIQALKKMKESTIISISPNYAMSVVDYGANLPIGYNELLTNSLYDTLGVKLISVEPEEFYDAVRNSDIKKSKEIAKMWISEAKEMKDTTEEEVIKSARMYLGFKSLQERYNASAITTHMRFLTDSGKIEDAAWPSFANAEFQKQGIQGLCQDYPHLATTHLLGYYLTGRPSMLGDIMIDPYNSVSIILHCGAPVNPYGNDRVPYTLLSHAESSVRGTGKPGSGACLQVDLPINKPVTIWKIDPINKRIILHTGMSIDGRKIYRNFDRIMCRTKLIVKTETKKVQRHIRMEKYGNHRSAIFGDLREQIKNVGNLIGFEVIEEDI